jgi:hypothetical protein
LVVEADGHECRKTGRDSLLPAAHRTAASSTRNSLRQNQIGVMGAAALSEALKSNVTLTTL